MLLSDVIDTHAHTHGTLSFELLKGVLLLLFLDVQLCPKQSQKWPMIRIWLVCHFHQCCNQQFVERSRLFRYEQLPSSLDNHCEANNELRLFKQCSVRIKAAGLAIHEQVCSKILDDVDEVVVELGLAISNRHMLCVKSVVNVW